MWPLVDKIGPVDLQVGSYHLHVRETLVVCHSSQSIITAGNYPHCASCSVPGSVPAPLPQTGGPFGNATRLAQLVANVTYVRDHPALLGYCEFRPTVVTRPYM